MSINPVKITDKLYDYLVNHSVRESPVARKLREETLTITGAQMMASPEVSQFIALMIKLINAKKVIEIGTFTGYTTLAMATALLDAEGKVITIDISEAAPQIGTKYWKEGGVLEKIDLIISPALTALDELILQGKSQSFDLGFIDADKGNYLQYYEKLLTLLRPGGLIVIDNTLWSGEVLKENLSPAEDKATIALKYFNDFVVRDERVDISMLPLGDGLTLALKN